MQLLDVIQMIGQSGLEASAPAELLLGTVTSTAPLEIAVDGSMAPLRGQVLYLTAAVVEKKIPLLAHGHVVGGLEHAHANSAGTTTKALEGGYGTSEALAGICCLENGAPLPVRGNYILLNRGLEEGDRVLLLRVRHGQRFVVLSRIFEQKEG